MSNSLLELHMRISPSTTWFDGFFVDVVLILDLPVYPQSRKDEWIRKCIVYHESFQILSSLALRIHGYIVLHLSLDMHQTALKYGSWIHLFECCSYPNSAICSTWDDICITHMISEESEILCNIFFSLSIPYTEPDYFLSHVCIVDEQYSFWSVFAFGEPISIDHDMMYIWIYFTDTGNKIPIKTILDILPYPIFYDFLLICNLTRTISFSDIVLKYIGSFYIFSLILFFSFDETNSTIQTLQFLWITLISTILFGFSGSTPRTFFLAYYDEKEVRVTIEILYNTSILFFWLCVAKNSVQTAHYFFYLPEFCVGIGAVSIEISPHNELTWSSSLSSSSCIP